MMIVPFVPYPPPAHDAALDRVAAALDSVLTPFGFAPGQVGGADRRGQVIFCRGDIGSNDGVCVDLVVDLEARPDWRITDVRYWGHSSDRWHWRRRGRRTRRELTSIARTLPNELA